MTYHEWLSHHLNEPWHPSQAVPDDRFAKESLSLQHTFPPTAWMGRCGNAIAARPLGKVVLPGAHDCGTYSLSRDSAYAQDLKSVKALRTLSAIGLDKFTKGIVASWAVCQNATTREQLYHGVRYFDLRVAYLKGEFYIWHGLCGERIESVFAEMAEYARLYPTEILILDLVPHHFNDFTTDLHKRFGDLLYATFGSTLCSADKLSPWSTVSQFWDSQTNVIVLYQPPERFDENQSKFWWEPAWLDSHWPKHCKNAEQWVTWAKEHVNKRSEDASPLWVLQGVITPDVGIVAKFNGVNSVQDLSRLLNPRAIHFLMKNANQDHNIIMLDFYDNCPLNQLCYFANVGGRYVFPDTHGFTGTGHHCHFQTTSVIRHEGSFAIIAIAQNTRREWFSAIMSPEDPLIWSPSSQLRGLYTNDIICHSTMRLFTLDYAVYATIATPVELKILRYDLANGAWSPHFESPAFSGDSGFFTPAPTHRATFTVLSSKHNGKPAYITGLTRNAITVVIVTSSFQPSVYNWEIPIGMLEPYFTQYAPRYVRDAISTRSQQLLNQSQSGASPSSRNQLTHSSTGVTPVHMAYTQVIPFELGDRLYLFCQGPVRDLFHQPPEIYENESIVFIGTYETGLFSPLALENLPPAVHRGIRAQGSDTPSELLLGSPWLVETAGNSAYFVCRSANGIRTWKFDGQTVSEIPIYRAFTDTFHWHEPVFASSLRLFVLHERLFLIGRSLGGLVLISLQDGIWVPAPGLAEFTDYGGWNSEEHAHSLQVDVVGNLVYVTGRNQYGILSVAFDGAEWHHFERPIVRKPCQ